MQPKMIKIAVVEDNEIMADKIKKILLNALALLQIKDSEYQLDTYYDGESVLASGIDYDISFIDVDLGSGIDGFEVGRKMNEIYKVKPLLVVLTNFTDRGEDSSDLRAYWYLTKSSIEAKLHPVATSAIKVVIPEGTIIKVNGKSAFVHYNWTVKSSKKEKFDTKSLQPVVANPVIMRVW